MFMNIRSITSHFYSFYGTSPTATCLLANPLPSTTSANVSAPHHYLGSRRQLTPKSCLAVCRYSKGTQEKLLFCLQWATNYALIKLPKFSKRNQPWKKIRFTLKKYLWTLLFATGKKSLPTLFPMLNPMQTLFCFHPGDTARHRLQKECKTASLPMARWRLTVTFSVLLQLKELREESLNRFTP